MRDFYSPISKTAFLFEPVIGLIDMKENIYMPFSSFHASLKVFCRAVEKAKEYVYQQKTIQKSIILKKKTLKVSSALYYRLASLKLSPNKVSAIPGTLFIYFVFSLRDIH